MCGKVTKILCMRYDEDRIKHPDDSALAIRAKTKAVCQNIEF